jgi:hypothetical protein
MLTKKMSQSKTFLVSTLLKLNLAQRLIFCYNKV